MPQIIVTADRSAEDGADLVMFRERVTEQDLESEHFSAQLMQRIEWAVGDAHEADRNATRRTQRRRADRQSQPRPSASVVTTAS